MKRGHWLVDWACAQKLAIANTPAEKSFEKQWTYESDSVNRQLDFCLLEVRDSRVVDNVEANDDILLGHDHRVLQDVARWKHGPA